jgi:glycerophosphoryl diester phosphodiesterase
MLDLKEDGLERGIVEALRGSPFEPVVVCGHYWGSMREIERQVPGTAVSLTLDRKWQDLYGPALIERLDSAAVTVDWRVLDPALVARCHARGLAVLAWTVDEPALMRRVLALGVDGLTSNRPDLFAAVEAE